MAVKARPWTAIDKEIAKLLTENKESRKWSYRTIEEKSGINYVRVRDISNAEHGTPTVMEYIAICETFGLDPASTLRRIILRAAEESTAERNDDEDERIRAAEQAARSGDWVPAADEDKDKTHEIHGEAGDAYE